jgi:hypothetical protein
LPDHPALGLCSNAVSGIVKVHDTNDSGGGSCAAIRRLGPESISLQRPARTESLPLVVWEEIERMADTALVNVNGVGAATALKLIDAGIPTAGALAEASPDVVSAIPGLGGARAAGVIAAAKALVGEPETEAVSVVMPKVAVPKALPKVAVPKALPKVAVPKALPKVATPKLLPAAKTPKALPGRAEEEPVAGDDDKKAKGDDKKAKGADKKAKEKADRKARRADKKAKKARAKGAKKAKEADKKARKKAAKKAKKAKEAKKRADKKAKKAKEANKKGRKKSK